jgi:cytochrome c551/c552
LGFNLFKKRQKLVEKYFLYSAEQKLVGWFYYTVANYFGRGEGADQKPFNQARKPGSSQPWRP